MTRILILDYRPDILRILEAILETAGCEVLTTPDSYEAWALLHSVPVDLFTQDLTLSDFDGHEFLRLLRADIQLRSIPVLIVSGRVDEREITAAYKEGADGYATKPFTSRQIFNMINVIVPDCRKFPLSISEVQPKPSRIEAAIQALKDRDTAVRLAAINSLKWLKDAVAVEPIASLTSDSQIEVRWAAIHSLGLLNDRRAVQPLIALLTDADILNRWAAALALGRLGAKEALKPLVTALADKSSLVHMMAALGLGYLKEPSVVTSLRMRLTDSDPMVARAAGKALDEAKAQAELRKAVHTRSKREKKASPVGPSTDVWFWRLFLLAIAVFIGLTVHDYWTEEPPTLFERLLTQSVIPGGKLEAAIPSLLERGYSCEEILRTIGDVRMFIQTQVLAVPSDEAQSIIAVRLAAEREKRRLEARTHPQVYTGGLRWLRLKKGVFGKGKKFSRCP